MTTTIVRDSIVGDRWIQDTAAAVPIGPIFDEHGQPTGDFVTGPVRLAFESLWELPQPTATMQNPKFGAALLFTPLADFTPLYNEYYRICAAKFADYWDAQTQQYNGLHSPFRDQREKTKFGGFTPGCIFMTCTSRFKPNVVDIRRNPIVDRSKVYPGVWAICSVNGYDYHDPRKKGVGFGIQSVMIIGDDTRLGGGPQDVNKAFAKVNVSAPIVAPNVGQMMPAGHNPPPPGMMPGRPGAGVPQQTWSPPAVPGYAPPPPAGPPADDDNDWMN